MLKSLKIILLSVIISLSLPAIAKEPNVIKKNHAEYRQAGNFTFISSLPPIDPISGDIPKKAEDQVNQVFANLYGIVNKLGAEMKDIVKITVYVNNSDIIMPLVNNVMDKYFTAEPYAARTPVTTSFGSKPYVLTVDAIVYIDPKI